MKMTHRRNNTTPPVLTYFCSFTNRYELDDMEIVTLLNKSREQQQNNEADETERTVRCNKCRIALWHRHIGGFFNPASATVCRDCNSLLRGTKYLSSISRKVY